MKVTSGKTEPVPKFGAGFFRWGLRHSPDLPTTGKQFAGVALLGRRWVWFWFCWTAVSTPAAALVYSDATAEEKLAGHP